MCNEKRLTKKIESTVFMGVFALQENPEEKREKLRQEELKKNTTGALRDGIDRAENGNLAEQEDIIELFNTILHRGGI